MKPDLLFLSAHLPGPKAPQAGHKTAFRNLRWLSEAYRLHLVAFRTESDGEYDRDTLSELCASTHIFPVNRTRRILAMLSRPWLPFRVAARWQASVAGCIRRLVEEFQPARLHCEFTQMGLYLRLAPHIPTRTLNIADILWQWADRRRQEPRGHGALWHLECRRLRHWESCCYRQFTRIFAPSKKDADCLGILSPAARERISVLPAHFDRYPARGRELSDSPPQILFWGALGRSENAEAARWLYREVLPAVRKSLPEISLILAGSNPPRDLTECRDPGVSTTGFISDPGSVFSTSHLAILPLFKGAGVKVKVLECLAAGLPVVTTPVGAEGIDATENDGLIVVPPETSRFCQTILHLFADRNRLHELSRGAVGWGMRQDSNQKAILLDDSKGAA